MIKVEQNLICSPDGHQESGALDQKKANLDHNSGVCAQFNGTLAEEFCTELMFNGMTEIL